MSEPFIKSEPIKIDHFALPKEDWEKFFAALTFAEKMFQAAHKVTDAEWKEWTAELGDKQGFPAIIYHDMPVIARPDGA